MSLSVTKFYPPIPNRLPDHVPGLWDHGNPTAAYNVLPPTVAEKMLEAQLQFPELFLLDEHALKKELKRRSRRPITTTENLIRLKFWCEIQNCMAFIKGTNRVFNVTAVCNQVCSTDSFYHYISQPFGCAWLACMPVTRKDTLLTLLDAGAHRMRAIMDLDPIDEATGKINTKLAKLQLDIHHATEQRLYGAVPQTTQNLNVNIDNPSDVQVGSSNGSPVLLNDQVSQLENMDLSRVKKVIPELVDGTK